MAKRAGEKTERISTMLSKDTVEKLQNEAKSKGLTVSGLIRMYILEQLNTKRKD